MCAPWSHCMASTSILPWVFQLEESSKCMSLLQAKSDGLTEAAHPNSIEQPNTVLPGETRMYLHMLSHIAGGVTSLQQLITSKHLGRASICSQQSCLQNECLSGGLTSVFCCIVTISRDDSTQFYMHQGLYAPWLTNKHPTFDVHDIH